jgi:hypothetical protein
MASIKKFSMQQVFEIGIFDIVTNEIEAYLEDVKTSGIEMSAEVTYAMGGRGNPYLVGFSHSRRATANVVNAVATTEIMALQSGQPVATGANKNVVKKDVLKVAANKVTTSFTALGTAGSEIGVIYTLVNGTPTTRYEQAGTLATGKFTYDSGTKVVTFFTGDLADDVEVVMYYNFTTDVTAQTIKYDSDKFAGNKKVIFFGLATDACTKEVFEAQFIFHNAKLSDSWSYDISADGDPIVQNLGIEAVKACGENTLVEVIIFDGKLAS